MKAIFGGTIAVILLAIYVYFVWEAYRVVEVARTCTLVETGFFFNQTVIQAFNTIGGLVSALVIAELAITRPGSMPGDRFLAASAQNRSRKVVEVLTVLYVLVWLVTGLMAFLKGIRCPDTLPVLTNVGQTWLGLAVAAAYAYFGLRAQEN